MQVCPERVNPLDPAEDPLAVLCVLARYKFVFRQLRGHERVLDAPCGLGYGAAFLARGTKGRVLGTDIDVETIDIASKTYADYSNLTFLVGDLRQPQDWGDFHIITCFDGLEHLALGEGRDLLRYFWVHLLPGGAFYLSTPQRSARTPERQKLHGHQHEYSYQELVDIVAQTCGGPALVLGQADEHIGSMPPECAWHLFVRGAKS